jgi:predicted nucleic acid-binding protein
MKRWLIDTDVLVDCLRGNLQATEFLKDALRSSCMIATISVAELYAGVREGAERPILEQFIKQFHVAELSNDIAQQGGLFKRDYGKSHNVGLADALIAACALYHEAQLATLNKKHYPMLKHVHVPYKK